MNPLISIIIPAFNREKHIERCIKSALKQSYSNIEVIIVDDGSKDNTPQIIKKASLMDHRVKGVFQPNKGAAEARKAGIMASKGEYLMFIDSDDWITPDAVDFLYNKCIEYDLDCAYGVMVQFVNNKRTKELTHPATGVLSGSDYTNMIFTPTCKTSSCAALFKYSLWQNDVFPKYRIPCEDIYSNILLSKFINKIGLYNHNVYYYSYNPDSLTATHCLSKSELWELFFEGIRKNLSQRNLLAKYELCLRYWEIDRLAFYYKRLDSSIWLERVLAYPNKDFSLRYKFLQKCIKYNVLFAGLQYFRKTKKFLKGYKR